MDETLRGYLGTNFTCNWPKKLNYLFVGILGRTVLLRMN